MDALVRDGVELDRAYAFKYCSPSRCALQSGRNPLQVNVLNYDGPEHNPRDPVGGWMGMARNFTGVATKLRGAGYSTHHVGKWDVGQATPDHTPRGRGYDSSLIFFMHENVSLAPPRRPARAKRPRPLKTAPNTAPPNTQTGLLGRHLVLHVPRRRHGDGPMAAQCHL
jgi:arylsulfatase A-like enzyme